MSTVDNSNSASALKTETPLTLKITPKLTPAAQRKAHLPWKRLSRMACLKVLDNPLASVGEVLHAVDLLLLIAGYGSRTSAGVRHRAVTGKLKRKQPVAIPEDKLPTANHKSTARQRLSDLIKG
ncbi:Uncharacterised protein [uncultured archaeon]|nr:Uncharacterised protein [uncultured archaeon]